MKRMIVFCFSLMICACGLFAENAQQIIGNVISTYSGSKSISANYRVASSQGHSSGSIVMSGNKFRILSSDLKCWYDGKTQWAYSKVSGEVNVTNPTSEELQMTNPYVAAISFRNNYTSTIVSKTSLNYTIKLLPKKKDGQLSQVVLIISKKGYQIEKATFTMKDKTSVSVSISEYKKGGNYGASTFVYNKNLVPKGTTINDLR